MSELKESDSLSDVDPIKRSIKYGTTFQAIKGIIFEYFSESSIHGFKYISDPKRSAFERIIWMGALIFSIVTCCHLIADIWKIKNENPVIVTFSEKPTPVWEIPFPLITICPETKAHSNIFNYSTTLLKIVNEMNITDEEQYFWEPISQTCHLTTDYGKPVANTSDLIKAMLQAAPSFDETFRVCLFGKYRVACNRIFEYVLTAEGICFSHNWLGAVHYREELYNLRKKHLIGRIRTYDIDEKLLDWNLENGFNKEARFKTFPDRVFGSDDYDTLKIYMHYNKNDDDQLCRDSVQGFKLILQTPGDEPQVSKNFINIPFDQRVTISITPKIMTTSEGLRSYDPKRRQCYYQNEIYLRYFKVYTQANCEAECLANQTLASCGCVQFSMPRNFSHPVCGAQKNSCMFYVVDSRNMYKYDAYNFRNVTGYERYFCIECLPTCSSIEYEAELKHSVPLQFAKRLLLENKTVTESMGYNQIIIKFKENTFIGLRRSELYSMSDFIASTGGLLGLFMGVSILSLVEFVYFFTVRLWMNLQTRRRKQQELNKSKVNEA